MAVVLIDGYEVMLDDDLALDIDPSKWKCRYSRGAYFRTVCRKNGRRKTAWLHHIAAGAKKGSVVDHKNNDRLDNRRSNLRICTVAENSRNRSLGKDNTSGYKGVHKFKHAKQKPWMAQIRENRKRKFLGYFNNARDAAIAYNNAAIRIYGEFAKLNEV